MKEEIAATVFFVARLAKKHGKLDRLRRGKFAVALSSVLFENYKSHWYPENPCKGQAFRWGLGSERGRCRSDWFVLIDRTLVVSGVWGWTGPRWGIPPSSGPADRAGWTTKTWVCRKSSPFGSTQEKCHAGNVVKYLRLSPLMLFTAPKFRLEGRNGV